MSCLCSSSLLSAASCFPSRQRRAPARHQCLPHFALRCSGPDAPHRLLGQVGAAGPLGPVPARYPAAGGAGGAEGGQGRGRRGVPLRRRRLRLRLRRRRVRDARRACGVHGTGPLHAGRRAAVRAHEHVSRIHDVHVPRVQLLAG